MLSSLLWAASWSEDAGVVPVRQFPCHTTDTLVTLSLWLEEPSPALSMAPTPASSISFNIWLCSMSFLALITSIRRRKESSAWISSHWLSRREVSRFEATSLFMLRTGERCENGVVGTGFSVEQ